MTDRRAVHYTVSEDGFKYHAKKCQLLKGSTVSKHRHPIPEVEKLKEKLIKTGRLVDSGDCYVCKRNVSTGMLMAYNLHYGYLKDKHPEFVVAINILENEDNDIKEIFKLGGTIFSADNAYPKAIEKDCYRIVKVMKATIDIDFFTRNKSDEFSQIETFVVEVLKSVEALTQYRRGDANKKECDILDEAGKRQIEIVRFLDEKISNHVRYNRKPDSEEQALLFEYCDIGFNKVPEGVINKFTKKNYTDRYSKELAIYTIGSKPQAMMKIKKLIEMLEERNADVITQYERLHIIVHDPLIDEQVYYSTRDNEAFITDSNFTYNPISNRQLVSADEMLDEEKYFVLKENIFNRNKQIMWMTGKDIIHEFSLI